MIKGENPIGRGVTALMLACAVLAGGNGFGQEPKHSEYEVKAAYIYNFGKFVKWPSKAKSGSGDPYTICVLGEDPFGALLDATLEGQTIDGKSVAPRRISKAQDAAHCRILFISSSEENQLKEVLTTLGTMSVLTVSDMPKFTRRGGIIQFVVEENKVRFQINLAGADRAGLTLSSQLLKLAVSVRGSP